MKMILRISVWFILSVLLTAIFAQESACQAMVRYTPGFKFQDGLYLNFEMVKTNHPVPMVRIVTDHKDFNKFGHRIFDQIHPEEGERIIFYDDNGVETSVLAKDVWGYALDDRLYIMLGSRFQEIKIQGAISLFIASATTTELIYPRSDGGYTDYTAIKRIYFEYEVTVEDRNYLFDFESNELREYNYEILEELLNKDSELYTEYTSLPKRQKKRMMLTFIRRYNEKHPLYFPVN